jgi:glutamine amidotransferase
MEKVAPIADVIKEQAAAGKPLLGICVGYQLLFEESYEMGTHTCLGLIKGKVVPIPTDMDLTIPHMGWNYVQFAEGMRLFDGLGDGKHFAFANSFYAQVTDPDAKAAYTEYGIQVTGAVEKGNIFGTQFHPEKSAGDGLQVLKNFVKICSQEDDGC